MNEIGAVAPPDPEAVMQQDGLERSICCSNLTVIGSGERPLRPLRLVAAAISPPSFARR
jgi:hypothetical protein